MTATHSYREKVHLVIMYNGKQNLFPWVVRPLRCFPRSTICRPPHILEFLSWAHKRHLANFIHSLTGNCRQKQLCGSSSGAGDWYWGKTQKLHFIPSASSRHYICTRLSERPLDGHTEFLVCPDSLGKHPPFFGKSLFCKKRTASFLQLLLSA